MAKAGAASWFVKFGITCAVLLACCEAAPHVFRNIPQFPPTTTDERQVVILDRYFQLPALDIVLVGSSLSYRLKEQFFEDGNVRNAALPGGSPLTGLAVIEASAAPRPQVIAVETNILNRGIDERLLQKFSKARQRDDAVRPLRSLAAYYQSALDDALTYNAARRRSILERPAATYDTERGMANALVDWNRPVYDEAILRDAKTLKSLVERLERQKVRIFFFEMPYPPMMDNSGYATKTRETLAQIFGARDNRWLKLDYAASELRWYDAAHLDDRSAIIFGSALIDAINKKLAAREGEP
jgi:hypothetical protein